MKMWTVFLVISAMSLHACTPPELVTAVPQSPVTPPMPTPEGLITYQDLMNKFELKYSAEDYYRDEYTYPGEAFALVLDINEIFAGKNLEEVRVNVSVNPACRSMEGYSPLTSDIEPVKINGVDFTKYSSRDAGTNTMVFEHTTYQAQYAENCYELNIRVREYVLTVFPDLAEYSHDLLNAKLDPLIQSFRFLNGWAYSLNRVWMGHKL